MNVGIISRPGQWGGDLKALQSVANGLKAHGHTGEMYTSFPSAYKLKNFDFRICVEIPIKAKLQNMSYSCLPSYERNRIGGIKKVNALKDGFLILTEIVKYFLKIKK